MPIKKWIVQYAIALPIIFSLLAGIQYLKGRSLEYSIEFGILLALVSVAIFAIRRFYNYRKTLIVLFAMIYLITIKALVIGKPKSFKKDSSRLARVPSSQKFSKPKFAS